MKLVTLVAALASVASGYTVLDAQTFDSAIKEGYWLVKFYSSTCPWSRRFAPVWEKVYTDLEETLAASDIKLAEVECKANRAVCDRAAIDGYPTVNFYDNGVNKGEVPGGQSFQALTRFAMSI
ncbi:hypothetical protein H4R18_003543 [Coemansia javaensis]|uniref:Thioredoxin domain-containing protein n=1 Tax=Coemansia javaensis TaxID=2761396 RepID=A0A9W8HBV6_9FUNG|nr:hypothetical protein H4R18_003543 [Coemansia javaensis]